ncbi:MAG: hypothetical protein GXP32_07865 [Kiritimatiellaeota bacterium]|nr:hypothetical protein [Kiritimatiellota bacterium]
MDYPFPGSRDPVSEHVYRIGIERETAYRNAFTKLFDMGHKTFLLDCNEAKLTAFQVARGAG